MDGMLAMDLVVEVDPSNKNKKTALVIKCSFFIFVRRNKIITRRMQSNSVKLFFKGVSNESRSIFTKNTPIEKNIILNKSFFIVR